MTIQFPTERLARNQLLVLLTASTGCAMTVLDTNIVAIVLPTIARDFGASFADIEWMVSAYVLCFASLLLPAGAIADRFGRRRVFLAGIGIFAFASLLCGGAPSAVSLYLARAFQGASAAFLLAPALATIGHTFHGETERARAWAIWGGMMGLTMVLAPIIGGVIAYSFGWRWAFGINVPICLALGVAVVLFVEESRDDAARSLDPPGILSFSAFVFGLTWGLINGQAQGWASTTAIAGFGVSICALLLFVIAERVQERQMLDLGLFSNPRFVGAVWAMFAYAACAQVMTSLLPLYLQNGLGRTVLEAGFSMLPFAVAMFVFPSIGRIISTRLTSRLLLGLGLIVVGLGNAITAWGAYASSWPLIMSGMVTLGAGGGLLNGETQKAIMSVVPRERAGMASGISTTSRFTGLLLGFAVLSGILATATRTLLTGRSCLEGEFCDRTRAFADAVVAGDLPQTLLGLAGAARESAIEQVRLAYGGGFAAALLTAAAIAGASSLAVYVLMRERSGDRVGLSDADGRLRHANATSSSER